MRLDLNLLEIFCYVVEEGSFSKAAQRLYLSQPTISGHIRNLETFVGTSLLDRLPRRIALTHAGRLLYRHGQLILQEKKAAIRDLKHILNCEQGALVVSGSTIPADYLLPPLVASFRARYPGVKMEVRIGDSRKACKDVLLGRAELGFVGAVFEADDIEFRHFGSDELALIVPNTPEWRDVDSISLSELAAKPFLVRESGSGTRRAFEKMLGFSLDRLNVVACLGSTGAVKEALKANMGVSVLSALAVATELAGGMLKKVRIRNVESMRRDFYVVRNRKLSLSPIAEAFLNHALAHMDTASAVDAVPLKSRAG